MQSERLRFALCDHEGLPQAGLLLCDAGCSGRGPASPVPSCVSSLILRRVALLGIGAEEPLPVPGPLDPSSCLNETLHKARPGSFPCHLGA